MTDAKLKAQSPVTVTVEGIGSFEVPAGGNLRETLRYEGVYIDGTCSDRGVCGRCVIRILDGDAGEPSSHEEALLEERSLKGGYRLACCVCVSGDLGVAVDPERILEIDSTGRWKEVWGSPLWRPDLITLDQTGYGVAVDLGTTSIATCLIDLSQAHPVDIIAGTNPQLPWGEEVISRLGKASGDPETAKQLAIAVWQTVDDQIRSLCRRSGVSRGRIRKAVVVGNSAMHHLCLGLPARDLLEPPYRPVQRESITLKPDELPVKLSLPPGTEIYFPPLIGGFAGSDILAAITAVSNNGVEQGAVVDVGTNTEIAVFSGRRAYVATAPSGPAFEGGHIGSGMRAEKGAVWQVAGDGQRIVFKVIGDIAPVGICGTGIVDALAVMLGNGSIERSGLLMDGVHPAVKDGRLTVDDGGRVVLYGEDVATIQKAKSAIAATWSILLKKLGLDPTDLEAVYMAGSFGSRLDRVNAMKIGLLPYVNPKRLVLAGNSALIGAAMILLSGEVRERAETWSEDLLHINVAEESDFEEQFIDNLYFPEQEEPVNVNGKG